MLRFDPDLLRHCWFLAGPTAVGKTAISLELAGRLGAEIVALDSMTLYRGMDLGTAKPDLAARQRVPHHLLDILDPADEFSVAEYVAAARDVCSEIVSRGQTPLFVGGTGLYLRGILRGVFQGPPADWAIRRRWQDLAHEQGAAALHAQLDRVDPTLARKLHPNDIRRVIRGLEVHELTGQPLSELQRQPPLPEAERPRHVYWLAPPRAWLHARIDQRVCEMFQSGLVDEVRRLLASPRPLGRTARQALGYKEVFDHLERGVPLESTVALIQTRTRQFAKRQHTWFRHLVECQPVPLSGDESAVQIADRLLPAPQPL
ncbi:MAG: tRNA (adenosine(37)-N6)-dimethylallyltransferase MiaA [Planctomycetaceae bacterium]